MRLVMIGLMMAAGACGGDDAGDSDASDSSDSTDSTDSSDSTDSDDSTDGMPVTVTLSGTTSEVGLAGESPVGGVLIEAFFEGTTTPSAMTTSATDGSFSISLTSESGPVNGYLKATKGTEYLDTYLYPPGPLSEDETGTPVLLLSSGTFDTLNSFAGGGHTSGMGFVGVAVLDGARMGIAGAMITSSPGGTVRYNDANGTPSSSANMTSADGTGYVFNVPPGTVTVGATKTGSTFTSHPVKAYANAITLTIVE